MASFYDLKTKTLDGKEFDLGQLRGKVALVVNTASECGFTPQYADLQKLHSEMAAKGVAVLGFPSNEFGGQEPGTSEEIQNFCSTKFSVTFPMFEKVETKGGTQSPVYKVLTEKHGEPKWNFHKYLVGKDGQVLGAYSSKVGPNSPELRKAIDDALAR